MDDVERLRELASKATQGPWQSVPVMYAGSDGTKSWSESEGRIINGPQQTVERETLSARWFCKADGDYIAAANPQTILELCAALTARGQEVDKLRTEIGYVVHAQRSNREYFDNDTAFADWAQSRLRAALAALQSGERPEQQTTGE